LQVTNERDQLERDVEQLCMSRGGHMFSSSYVLAQRLQFLEGEVKQQRLALRSVTTERDGMQEDMLQIRSSKRQADQVCLEWVYCTVAQFAVSSFGL
jgi:hypothetical protein